MRNKFFAGLAVASTVFLTAVGIASAEDPDPLESAITTVQTQLISYAAPIGAALVAIGLAYVAVKLIPRVIKMVSARLG